MLPSFSSMFRPGQPGSDNGHENGLPSIKSLSVSPHSAPLSHQNGYNDQWYAESHIRTDDLKSSLCAPSAASQSKYELEPLKNGGDAERNSALPDLGHIDFGTDLKLDEKPDQLVNSLSNMNPLDSESQHLMDCDFDVENLVSVFDSNGMPCNPAFRDANANERRARSMIRGEFRELDRTREEEILRRIFSCESLSITDAALASHVPITTSKVLSRPKVRKLPPSRESNMPIEAPYAPTIGVYPGRRAPGDNHITPDNHISLKHLRPNDFHHHNDWNPFFQSPTHQRHFGDVTPRMPVNIGPPRMYMGIQGPRQVYSPCPPPGYCAGPVMLNKAEHDSRPGHHPGLSGIIKHGPPPPPVPRLSPSHADNHRPTFNYQTNHSFSNQNARFVRPALPFEPPSPQYPEPMFSPPLEGKIDEEVPLDQLFTSFLSQRLTNHQVDAASLSTSLSTSTPSSQQTSTSPLDLLSQLAQHPTSTTTVSSSGHSLLNNSVLATALERDRDQVRHVAATPSSPASHPQPPAPMAKGVKMKVVDRRLDGTNVVTLSLDDDCNSIPHENYDLLQKLRENLQEVPMCQCIAKNGETVLDQSPYYTQLGAASSIGGIRAMMEERFGASGSAVRIEKVSYTDKEGKSVQGCPIAKWIIRRSGADEKLLVVLKERHGHYCQWRVIVVCIVAWEGVTGVLADDMYAYLARTLPTHGLATDRRCGTNEQKTCACQGFDDTKSGASFSFGCSWSMFYNGCKFARSRVPKKFKLKSDEEESLIEEKLQRLADEMAPLYKRLAPSSYDNQCKFDNVAGGCRLGTGVGRPFSGVTACVDYCAHMHKDLHNMNNGCTVVVSLTKHRGLSRPDEEQLHVLPFYTLDPDGERGDQRDYEMKVKEGALEVLSNFSGVTRIRAVAKKPKRKSAKKTKESPVKDEPPRDIPELGKSHDLDSASPDRLVSDGSDSGLCKRFDLESSPSTSSLLGIDDERTSPVKIKKELDDVVSCKTTIVNGHLETTKLLKPKIEPMNVVVDCPVVDPVRAEAKTVRVVENGDAVVGADSVPQENGQLSLSRSKSISPIDAKPTAQVNIRPLSALDLTSDRHTKEEVKNVLPVSNAVFVKSVSKSFDSISVTTSCHEGSAALICAKDAILTPDNASLRADAHSLVGSPYCSDASTECASPIRVSPFTGGQPTNAKNDVSANFTSSAKKSPNDDEKHTQLVDRDSSALKDCVLRSLCHPCGKISNEPSTLCVEDGNRPPPPSAVRPLGEQNGIDVTESDVDVGHKKDSVEATTDKSTDKSPDKSHVTDRSPARIATSPANADRDRPSLPETALNVSADCVRERVQSVSDCSLKNVLTSSGSVEGSSDQNEPAKYQSDPIQQALPRDHTGSHNGSAANGEISNYQAESATTTMSPKLQLRELDYIEDDLSLIEPSLGPWSSGDSEDVSDGFKAHELEVREEMEIALSMGKHPVTPNDFSHRSSFRSTSDAPYQNSLVQSQYRPYGCCPTDSLHRSPMMNSVAPQHHQICSPPSGPRFVSPPYQQRYLLNDGAYYRADASRNRCATSAPRNDGQSPARTEPSASYFDSLQQVIEDVVQGGDNSRPQTMRDSSPGAHGLKGNANRCSTGNSSDATKVDRYVTDPVYLDHLQNILDDVHGQVRRSLDTYTQYPKDIEPHDFTTTVASQHDIMSSSSYETQIPNQCVDTRALLGCQSDPRNVHSGYSTPRAPMLNTPGIRNFIVQHGTRMPQRFGSIRHQSHFHQVHQSHFAPDLEMKRMSSPSHIPQGPYSMGSIEHESRGPMNGRGMCMPVRMCAGPLGLGNAGPAADIHCGRIRQSVPMRGGTVVQPFGPMRMLPPPGFGTGPSGPLSNIRYGPRPWNGMSSAIPTNNVSVSSDNLSAMVCPDLLSSPSDVAAMPFAMPKLPSSLWTPLSPRNGPDSPKILSPTQLSPQGAQRMPRYEYHAELVPTSNATNQPQRPGPHRETVKVLNPFEDDYIAAHTNTTASGRPVPHVKPEPPTSPFTPPALKRGPGAAPREPDGQDQEFVSMNEECFYDGDMGGVAIALGHGSVLFEVAKREQHCTTALKNPNRHEPTRISLVFYQHKNLNYANHGWAEWEEKMEQRRQSKERAKQEPFTDEEFTAPTYRYMWDTKINMASATPSETITTSWENGKSECSVSGPYKQWS